MLHIYTIHVYECLRTYTWLFGSYINIIFFRIDTYWGWNFSSIIDCICDVAHVYKNITAHVYVFYDIYTLPRLRGFFCIYDLPMLTYTKCTHTCYVTCIQALVFLYMYNFIKSYTKYLQVYIRGLCHLYEVLLYVKKSCTYTKSEFSYTWKSAPLRSGASTN